MKNTYIVIALIVVVSILAFMFGSKKIEPPVNSAVSGSTNLSDGIYKLDSSKSTVTWSGDYTGGVTEEGSAEISSGSMMIAAGVPISGTFDIDMQSLKANKTSLEAAIRSSEFLGVEEYPTAKFEINKVIPNPLQATSTGKYIVDGFLTIKGVKTNVSFPATFSVNGSRITADSIFAINRTDWGIDSNKDVKNAIILNLHLEATK